MEKMFDLKELVSLSGIMNLFNAKSVKDIVALEKALMGFLTQEQLEQIAQMEKDILNDLVNAKNEKNALQVNYNKLVDKLSSIGINVNDIISHTPQIERDDEEEDYEDDEEEDFDDDEDYEEED